LSTCILAKKNSQDNHLDMLLHLQLICSNNTVHLLSLQGTSSTLSYDSDLADLVSKSNVLIVEGYLFELPHTIEAIKQACEDAHKNGALIAVTASDVSCIKRCYNDFW
jgi:sugar/nucleoside kinase (ribokinase family)